MTSAGRGWLVRFLKRFTPWGDSHVCDFSKSVRIEAAGHVTLGWGISPQLSMIKIRECSSCGAESKEGGFVYPSRLERDFNREYWPEGSDWPIDPSTGERMPLEKVRK